MDSSPKAFDTEKVLPCRDVIMYRSIKVDYIVLQIEGSRYPRVQFNELWEIMEIASMRCVSITANPSHNRDWVALPMHRGIGKLRSHVSENIHNYDMLNSFQPAIKINSINGICPEHILPLNEWDC